MSGFRVLLVTTLPLGGLEITVDYRYDSLGFFDDPAARVVIEAAAARWSRIVDETLLPVNMTDGDFIDGRFKLLHPATGLEFSVSAAASMSTDFAYNAGQPAANEYLGGFTLEADEWILFVGGRPLTAAARGGPIESGLNLGIVHNDPDSFLNRGFNVGLGSLAVIGGHISFDSDRDWNFNLGTTGTGAEVDFYSVAIHEIGHGLGLNSRGVAEWTGMVSGLNFVGSNAVAAYNLDNGTSLSSLQISSPSANDYHWKEGEYDARIFPFGAPLLTKTVGLDGFQDLLMEPAFSSSSGIRLEVTNVDAAALLDLGWSIITENPPSPPELTEATNPAPVAGGGMGFEIASEVGVRYVIQTSLDGASWVDVKPALIGDGGTLSWSDGQEGFTDGFGPASNLGQKFYRVLRKD